MISQTISATTTSFTSAPTAPSTSQQLVEPKKPQSEPLSISQINKLLVEAEMADSRQGETLDVLDWRGFGLYSATDLDVGCFSYGEDHLNQGDEITEWDTLRSHSIHRQKGSLSNRTKPQPRQVRYTGQFVPNHEGTELNPYELEDRKLIKQDMALLVQGRRRTQHVTMLGVIHNLVKRSGDCMQVFDWDETGLGLMCDGADRERGQDLATREWTLVTALTDTVNWVTRHWRDVGAANSRNAVRRAIDFLRDAGLLDYYSEMTPGVYGASRRYTYMNIPVLLILAEVLEENMGGYDELPGHKASCLKCLYDAIFTGWGYGRTGDADTTEPDTFEGSDRHREYMAWLNYTHNGADPDAPPPLTYRQKVIRAWESMVDKWRRLRSEFGPDHWETKDARDAWERYQDDFGWLFL